MTIKLRYIGIGFETSHAIYVAELPNGKFKRYLVPLVDALKSIVVKDRISLERVKNQIIKEFGDSDIQFEVLSDQPPEKGETRPLVGYESMMSFRLRRKLRKHLHTTRAILESKPKGFLPKLFESIKVSLKLKERISDRYVVAKQFVLLCEDSQVEYAVHNIILELEYLNKHGAIHCGFYDPFVMKLASEIGVTHPVYGVVFIAMIYPSKDILLQKCSSYQDECKRPNYYRDIRPYDRFDGGEVILSAIGLEEK